MPAIVSHCIQSKGQSLYNGFQDPVSAGYLMSLVSLPAILPSLLLQEKKPLYFVKRTSHTPEEMMS